MQPELHRSLVEAYVDATERLRTASTGLDRQFHLAHVHQAWANLYRGARRDWPQLVLDERRRRGMIE